MSEKYKSAVIFGTDDARHAHEGHWSKIDGDPVIQEFDTVEELNAYLQGVDDAIGWLEHHQLEDQELAELLKSRRRLAVKAS